jgi:hypothetical protein
MERTEKERTRLNRHVIEPMHVRGIAVPFDTRGGKEQ